MPPDPGYPDTLLKNLIKIEDEVAGHDRALVRLVHNRAELDGAIKDGAIALLHAVEGGFSVGDGERQRDRRQRGQARAEGRRLRDGGAPPLPPGGDQRPALPFIQGLDSTTSSSRSRGEGLTDGDRPRARDGQASGADRHLAHAPDAVAETFQVLDKGLGPRPPDAGRPIPRGLSLREAGVHARQRDHPADQAAKRRGRRDHGAAPAQRRAPEAQRHQEAGTRRSG